MSVLSMMRSRCHYRRMTACLHRDRFPGIGNGSALDKIIHLLGDRISQSSLSICRRNVQSQRIKTWVRKEAEAGAESCNIYLTAKPTTTTNRVKCRVREVRTSLRLCFCLARRFTGSEHLLTAVLVYVGGLYEVFSFTSFFTLSFSYVECLKIEGSIFLTVLFLFI